MKYKTTPDQETLMARLRAVEPIEPSDFLFSRIRKGIEARKNEKVFITPQFAWRMAAVFVALLLVNVFVLFVNPQEIVQETTMVAEELGLLSDNYYDNY